MSQPALVRRSPVHRGRVVTSTEITPRTRRVTVQADSMVGVTLRPAQDVELHLREESGRRVKRRYTIRHARPEVGELDLDVVLHGAGPGARWGETATAGDEIEFSGPRGKLALTASDWHLLAGDEAALPAILAICEALPAAEPAIAVVEVQDEDDEVAVPDGTTVHWVHRGDAPPGTPDLLHAVLRSLVLPDGAGHGYLMGETRAMVALRTLLEERGLAHEAIFVKGYWNLGRPDRLANRPPR